MERPRHVQVFVDSYLPCARSVELFLRIPVSVTLAYAAIESDWGRSSLARKGIIFSQPLPPENVISSTSVQVSQIINKKETTLFFRKMSPRESFMAFGENLRMNALFEDAQRYKDDPERFLGIIAAGFQVASERDKAQMARMALKEFQLKDFDSWIYSDLPVNELLEI